MGETLMRPIEVRFQKNINNLTLIREADTKRQWEQLVVVALGALFVAGLLFYGWQHFRYIQYGYKLEAAQKKQGQLIQTRNVLRLHREQLQNPTRIESIAREMGMVRSVSGQLVTVNLDTKANPQPQLSAQK
jgi:cell division protein FtsB